MVPVDVRSAFGKVIDGIRGIVEVFRRVWSASEEANDPLSISRVSGPAERREEKRLSCISSLVASEECKDRLVDRIDQSGVEHGVGTIRGDEYLFLILQAKKGVIEIVFEDRLVRTATMQWNRLPTLFHCKIAESDTAEGSAEAVIQFFYTDLPHLDALMFALEQDH